MPNTPETPPSLKTLVDAIVELEKQYGSHPFTDTDRVRQKAALKFLGSLKEAVQAFCLQGGGDDEDELGYLYGLRGR